MKLRSVLVLVTAILLGIAGCGGAQSRYASHMSKGDDFFAAANYEKARIEFRNALQILPNDAQARYMYGRSMERLGKVREAAGMYQGAIDSDTNHAGARAALGRVFVFAGAPQKALELVEPALAKNANDAELLTVRAAARSQLDQRDAALVDAEAAVKLAPTNENAVALLASIYRQGNDAPRAVALLRTTLEKAPAATELRQVLSLLYLSLGDKVGAETEMRKIIEQRPEDARARYSLAIFLAGEKRLDDAETVLKEAIAAAPDNDDAKLVYADFLSTQREPARGVAALEGFIREAPDNYDLRLGLGALQQRTGNNAKAIAVYQEVIARAGTKPQGLIARNRVAAMYAAERKNDAARKLVQEVLAENPRDNDALLLRGNLAMQGNDPAAAIGDLRAVLRDQPEAVPVLRALARAHVANHEPALAEETLQRAVALSPGDPDVRVELAQMLAQAGKSEQALPLIEQTVRDNPTHVLAREMLVRMYLARADYPAARVAAEDLKTLAPTKAVGFYLAGIAAQAEKRGADAQASFEQALQLQPDAADALAALARLHVTAGHPERAQAAVEQVLARNPDNFAARNLLGELHLASKEFAPAQQEFTQGDRGGAGVAARLAQPRARAAGGERSRRRGGDAREGRAEDQLGFLAGRRSRRALRAQSGIRQGHCQLRRTGGEAPRPRGGREQPRHAARDLSQGPEEPGSRARAHGAIRQFTECRSARHAWLGALSPRAVRRSADGARARQPDRAAGAGREVPPRHGAVQERAERAGAREPAGGPAEQVGRSRAQKRRAPRSPAFRARGNACCRRFVAACAAILPAGRRAARRRRCSTKPASSSRQRRRRRCCANSKW